MNNKAPSIMKLKSSVGIHGYVLDELRQKASDYRATTARDDPRLDRDHTLAARQDDIARPMSWAVMAKKRRLK